MASLLDRITGLVAGRANIEKCQQRAFEKHHGELDTEGLFRNATCVATEATSSALGSQFSIFSDTPSQLSLQNDQSSISSDFVLHNQLTFQATCSYLRPLPLLRIRKLINYDDLHQLESTNPIRSTTGAPDITATDLSEDELKRVYSKDDVWDRKNQRIPPLLQCSGIGRYRMSITADRDWQEEKLDKNLRHLDPEIVGHLASSEVGGSSSALHQRHLRNQESRNNSIASFQGSRPRPNLSPASDFIDPATGTRVTRGFSPSVSPSANNSFRNVSRCLRRDSGIASPSPVSNTSSRHCGQSKRRQSSLTMDLIMPNPLGTIEELQPVCDRRRKIERPCEFNEGGDPDSALASDDEDEEWSDMSKSTAPETQFTQLLRTTLDQNYVSSDTQQTETESQFRETVLLPESAAVKKQNDDVHKGQELAGIRAIKTKNSVVTAIKPVLPELSLDSRISEDLWVNKNGTSEIDTPDHQTGEWDSSSIISNTSATALRAVLHRVARRRQQRERSNTAFRTTCQKNQDHD